MKKFSFSLENVLRYKNQLLDGLKAERAALMMRVIRQEEKIEGMRQRYREANERYCEQKKTGFTTREAHEYDAFFRSMERAIRHEMNSLRNIARRKKKSERK